MTSLSSQLKHLAVPFASAFAVDADKRRASFLFDPHEAANIDRATFHSIGLNGLEELKQLQPSFELFEDTLFGDESVSFERLVQSQSVNEELDRQISSFLLRLCPYFQLKAAWKALEWLVYRYHIHQMNIDDLLRCAFPYHETNVFVRVVQMINLDSPSSIWHWLQPIQKPGVVLSRVTVLNHAASDPVFLAFLCNSAKMTVKLFLSENGASTALLNPMMAFYVSTVAGAIARVDKPSEQLVATLFPYLSRSFKSQVSDYKLSGYMIASQLVLKVKLKGDIVDELVYKLVKGFDASSESLQSLLCVIAIIFSAQNITGLKAKTWSLFLKLNSLPNGLADMQRTGVSCDSFVSTIATAVFRRIFAAKSLLETMEVDDGEDEEDCHWLLTLLDDLFVSSELIMSYSLASTLMTNLLNQFCIAYESDRHVKKSLDFFKNSIANISKRHPATVDKVFSTAYSENAENETKLEAVRKFVSFATKLGGDANSCRHDILSEVGTSLFLALNSANSELRRLAVGKLREDADLEVDFVTSSLKERLVDEDSSVSLEAIETLRSKWPLVNPVDFLPPLQTILYEKAHIYSQETRTAAISFLLTTSWNLTSDEHLSRLFWLAAPFYLLGNDELALFAPNNPKLKLLSVCGQISNETRLAKLASTTSNDRFSEEILTTLSRRQLAFAASILSSKIASEGAKNLEVSLVALIAVLKKLIATPSVISTTTSPDKMVELDKLDILTTLERILNPPSKDTKADYVSLLVVKIFKSLFDGSSIFQVVFDEETVKKGLFGGENSVNLFWQVVKLLLNCCNSANATNRPLFRKAFGSFGRSFFDFNAMLMLRFSVFPERTECQVFLLQSFEVMLEKVAKLPTMSKSLSALTPLIDLLTVLANKDQALSKLAVSCLGLLKQLKFWSAFPVVDNFVDHLLENRAEIASSPQNVQSIIASYFTGSTSTAQILSSPKKSPKRKSPRRVSQSENEQPEPSDLLSLLFQSVIDADLVTDAPWYLVRILWLLREVKHSFVLPHISPLVSKLPTDPELADSLAVFYSPKAARLVEGQVLDTYLHTLKPNKTNSLMRKVIFQRLSSDFFANFPNEDVQFKVASRILDLHVSDKSVGAGSKLMELGMTLPLFKRLLIALTSELNVESSSPSPSRKRRLSRGVSFSEDDQSIPAKIALILECLQTSTSSLKKEPADFLIDPVCDLFENTFTGLLGMKGTYAIKLEPQLDNETEYFSSPDLLRQLCLTCLSNIFNNYKVENVSEFRSSGVLSCLGSENLQTQQHALILVEAVAKRKPEFVRELVSDFFSCVCTSSMLAQEDPYTCRVVGGVTGALIPLLLLNDPSCGVSEMPTHSLLRVVDVFAKNWTAVCSNSNGEHIFAAIFKHCLSQRNVTSIALAVVLLICRRFSEIKDSDSSDLVMAETAKLVHFLTSVVLEMDSTFPPADLADLAEKMCSILKLKESGKKPVALEVASWVEWHDENEMKTLRLIRHGVLSFANRLFGVLMEKSRLDDEVSFSSISQQLFESVVCLATDDVSRITNSPSSTSPSSSISIPAAYLDEVMLAFEQTNALLSDAAFIDAAKNILADDDERKECDVTSSSAGETHWRMQLKTLQVLAERLPQIVSKDENLPHSTEKLCKLLIKKLKKSSTKNSLRHSICLVLNSLARSATGLIDSSDGGEVSLAVDCIRTTLEATLSILKGSTSLKATSDNLKFIALLLECASTCCASLGASALPSLGNLVNCCLAHLDSNAESFSAAQKVTGVAVPSSSLNALSQLLVAFSSFTSPFTADILCRLCVLKPIVAKWNVSRVSVEVSNRIDEVMTTLSTTHFRLLVPLFPAVYDRMRKEGASKEVLICFHGFVAKSMSKWNRDDILPHLTKLDAFFVSALDYRYENKDASLETVAMVEDEVIQSLITISLKLTESEMRPLFFKIFDWCSRAIEEGRSIRLITFYRFSTRLAESLKSLFHLFAAPVFKQAVEILQKTNPATVENGKTLLSDPKLDMLLAGGVLDTLALLFSNDASGFTTRNRFDTVESPLVDQLDMATEMESPDAYIAHIRDHAAPAIVALAVAVSEDAAWKMINQSLLTKTQHNLPKVRLAALYVLDLLVTRMAEDYSSAIQDTVPYLAPLLEDDDEAVESACRDLTAKLETILGEPISQFM